MLFNMNSCISQNEKVEMALKECVNESINVNIKEQYGKEPFDFYEFILDIEQNFISQDLLSNTTREEYLGFITDILNSDDEKYLKMYKIQEDIINNYGFGFNQFSINDNIFNQCPYKVSQDVKETKGKLIYEQGSKLKKLFDEGFKNTELIEDAIYSVDEENFNKPVFRASIILVAMINLDSKLNPDLKSLKERNKGKKFLNKD